MAGTDNSQSIDARLELERHNLQPDDLDFQPIRSEDEDYESAPPTYELNTYPADFTLEVLFQKWKAGDIEIPRFQRQFVWKQLQASKLVESFLIGLPVPAIFLYTERRTQKFLVIDGQQRLRSVFYYFEGFFGEEKKGKREVFMLKGLSPQSRFAELTFAELGDVDRRRLQNCVLRSFIVQQLDPTDDTSIYHIFERLNTGGTFLANQEIRNCVYRGSLNGLLHEINLTRDWRGIVGKRIPDSRQRDVELILRFFALLDLDTYRKPMKDSLSRFMKLHKDPAPEQLSQMRSLFESTCAAVAAHLGQKPFHILAGLNAAVFDCVMAAFARHRDSVPADVAGRYSQMTADADFLRLVSSGTTDEEVVRARFELAERRLFGVA